MALGFLGGGKGMDRIGLDTHDFCLFLMSLFFTHGRIRGAWVFGCGVMVKNNHDLLFLMCVWTIRRH